MPGTHVSAGTVSIGTVSGNVEGTGAVVLASELLLPTAAFLDATAFPGADIGAQINAAFASLPTGGGRVYLPSSSTLYDASTQISITANCTLSLGALTLQVRNAILLSNNASIVGLGNSSVIQGQSLYDNSVITNLGNVGQNEATATANSGIYLANFYVNARAGNNPAGLVNCIWLCACTNSLVENVYSTGMQATNSSGIRFHGGSKNTMLRCTAASGADIGLSVGLETGFLISDCTSTGNTGNGIDTNGASGTCQGKVVNCESTGNGQSGYNPDTCSGIQVTGGNFSGNNYGIAFVNPAGENIIVGARCNGNTLYGIWVNNNSSLLTISSCLVTANHQHGIFVSASSYTTIIGCMIIDNGQTTTNTYDGILLQSSGGNTLRNIIIGNSIQNQAGTTQRYGINESTTGGGTVGANTFIGNYIPANASGSFNNLQSSDQLLANREDDSGTQNMLTTSGFGNGAAGQAVTTTALGTGAGPAAPTVVKSYMKLTFGATAYWVPMFQ